jgi:type II secretory pathway pseudopilin PulG
MTLVEVVAGLALLGSLLVGLLLAKAGLSRQRAEAGQRLEAIAAADALLAQWRSEGRPMLRHATGRTGLDGRFTWSTLLLRNERVAGMSIEVVRLELSGDGPRGAKVLASAELLLAPPAPVAPPASQPAQSEDTQR